jgi:hypothetical protein
MSRMGKLVFFRRDAPADPKLLLESLLNMVSRDRVHSVFRTVGESKEFSKYQQSLEDEECSDADEEEMLPNREKNEIPMLYEEGSCLMIDVGWCTLSEQMDIAIRNNIDHLILGEFHSLNGIMINLGYHDIFEWTENPSGFLFARAFFSIVFWGYGTPNDWDAAREQMLMQPDVQRIRAEIERVTGRLESCVCWST